MSLQTALGKATEVSLPCRCEAQLWHRPGMARPSGSRDGSGRLGTWVMSMRRLTSCLRPGMIFCLPTNRQTLQTSGLIAGNSVLLQPTAAARFIVGFIMGFHLLLKKNHVELKLCFNFCYFISFSKTF